MHPEQAGRHAQSMADFVGAAPAFRAAIALLGRYARSRAPLMIVGETGTGKECAAQLAHCLSQRSAAPFIAVNCGALPDALVESELFGHARGAFTDASRARMGLVRKAEGGTLFLDEVEALSARAQVALLRFLQDATFRSIGEEDQRYANVRIIGASNVDLQQLVRSGRFRPDLLFRLDVLSIRLPPLRERIADIVLLVPHLLAKVARAEGEARKSVSPAAIDLLCMYSWPGNVRELEHALLRAHLLSAGPVIDAHDLRNCCAPLTSDQCPGAAINHNQLREEKVRAVSEVERQFVERALAQTNGNISEAARLCKMQRSALSKMVKKHMRGARDG